jgi:hypothetical protein
MKRNSQFHNPLAGVCSVLLVLCAGQPAFAQQSASMQPVAAVATSSAATTASAAKLSAIKPLAIQGSTEEEEVAAPAKPRHEGIKVHGHWVLQVKNADGTLGERREFENSLADGGAFLIGVLAGGLVPGDYAIQLAGTACPACYIINSTWNANNAFTQGSPTSTTLVTTFNSLLFSPSGGNSIVLTGFMAPPGLGLFSQVAVLWGACGTNFSSGSATIAPRTCVTTPSQQTAGGEFTATTLASPLPVYAGQIVMVTVTISFS